MSAHISFTSKNCKKTHIHQNDHLTNISVAMDIPHLLAGPPQEERGPGEGPIDVCSNALTAWPLDTHSSHARN